MGQKKLLQFGNCTQSPFCLLFLSNVFCTAVGFLEVFFELQGGKLGFNVYHYFWSTFVVGIKMLLMELADIEYFF